MRFPPLWSSLKCLENRCFGHGYFLLFVLILTTSFSIKAQNKNFVVNKTAPTWRQKIDPKEKRPADKDITEGYFLSFYENQTHIELAEDYNHLIREIVSEAGVQNGSQISVTYDPGFQQLIFHKVIVWRNGKSSDRLKASSFKLLQTEKELSRFIYSGTYDALMVLDDVRKGDRIEFAYTLKGFNPIYGKKYSAMFYFEGPSSVGHIYTSVIFNKSRNLKFKNFNFNTPPKITETGNMKTYEWESTLTKTYRTADFEPGWYNPLKRTQLSEFSNWSDVVNWGLAVNDYPNGKSVLLDKKVKELRALAGHDTKRYIKLATRFVQDEIRYMGIEIGAYSHRPNSPEKVLLQRYGDCKDKSLLLVKLLNANGVNAYMTYADTYGSTYKNDFLPSPFIFNHVIVMVDYDKRKTWIDPTISYQRGDFDDFYAPNYGNVLVIRKGVNTLEKIVSKPEGKLISNLRFKLADTLAGAKTTLEIYSVYTHNYADDIRATIAESGTEALGKTFLEYFGKMYPEIEAKNNIIIEDDENGNMLEIKEYYEISDIWADDDTDNGDKLASFYGDLISTELRKIDSKKRLTPIALKHYLNIEQNITINTPFPVPMHDENFKVESDNYFFDLYKSQQDSTIKFSYTYKNLTDNISGDQIKKYIADMKKIDAYLHYTVSRNLIASPSTPINFYTLLPYLLALGVAIFLLRKIYFKSTAFDIEKIADAIPIGGWLILLSIRVLIFPIAFLFKSLAVDTFNAQTWQGLSVFGDVQVLVKAGFIVEVVCLAGLLAYSLFCMILFFKRRVEFPKQFTLFSILYIGFLIFDLLFCLYLNTKSGHIALDEYVRNIIINLMFSIAFVWYLTTSERAKQTFVFTYPKFEWESGLTQYYEGMYVKKEGLQQEAVETGEQKEIIEIEDRKP